MSRIISSALVVLIVTTLTVWLAGERTSPRPGAAGAAAAPAAAAASVNLYGLDAHDGTIVQDGGTLRMNGLGCWSCSSSTAPASRPRPGRPQASECVTCADTLGQCGITA